MLLVCSSSLWFNQLSVPELIQHEQRPQHVLISRNLDSCSERQHFLKFSKVSQLEGTMFSLSLASNTSNALEYSNAENNRFFDSNECTFFVARLAAMFVVSQASP